MTAFVKVAGSGGGASGRQGGYSYLAVLFAVVISMAAMSGALQLWSAAQQREREVELLFVGGEFRAAIAAYYERTPGPAKRYPAELADLLKDNRFSDTRRYLRRLYLDPMTGKSEWGLIKAPEGGIMGVHSLSDHSPFKTAGFRFADRGFTGKAKYSEWQFVYRPLLPAAQAPRVGPQTPVAGPQPTPATQPASVPPKGVAPSK